MEGKFRLSRDNGLDIDTWLICDEHLFRITLEIESLNEEGWMDINYILKVKDAKAVDIQKSLQAAGIKVTSITEVFKEQGEEGVTAEA
jgi:hypothetical protein